MVLLDAFKKDSNSMSQLKKGALLSYINIFLTNGIGLFLTPFIIKSLGDSEYGLYTLIGAFVGYIAVMDLGLNNTIVRYVSKYRALKDKEGESKFLGTSMMIYSVISILVVLIGFIFYLNIDSIFQESLNSNEITKAKLMMLILIFNLAISLPGGAFTAICNSYEHFVFPRALSNVKYIIRSILILVILYYGSDSIGLVILDTIVNIITIVATFIYVKKNLQVQFNFSLPKLSFLKEIFSYSVWIFIFAIIGQMQWKGGQLAIGTNLNTSQVAIYAIGILLGTYYGAFSGAISNLFLPKATQMVVNHSNETELSNMLIKIARYSLFSLLLILVGFVMLGQDFILLWVGKGYEPSYYIAIIVMIGYTIPLMQTFANSLLEAKKLFKFKTIVYFISLSIGTLCSYIFVKSHGIIGVILSIVLGWIIGQVIMNIFFFKKLNLQIPRFFIELIMSFSKSLILILPLSYAITFIPIEGWVGFVIKAILIGLVYSVAIYNLTLNKEEKSTIKKILLWG